MKWGEMFFTPLVTYAHDILIKDPSFIPSLPDETKDIQTSTVSSPEITEDHLDILPAFQVEDLEARFAEKVIGAKIIPPFRNTTDNLQMMIDVDESDDDDDDDYDGDERPVDSDSHNETFPGESSNPSKPTLVDLKLPPTKRSRTPEAHLTRSKSISKAIKIVFSSGAKLSSQPPPLAVKEEQSIPVDNVEASELERKSEQVIPLSNATNQTCVETYKDKCLSKEPTDTPKVMPNIRLEVENHEAPQEPRHFRRLQIEKRESPREPRALRGL